MCDHFDESSDSKESSGSEYDDVIEAWGGCDDEDGSDEDDNSANFFTRTGYDCRRYAYNSPCIGIQSLSAHDKKRLSPKKRNKKVLVATTPSNDYQYLQYLQMIINTYSTFKCLSILTVPSTPYQYSQYSYTTNDYRQHVFFTALSLIMK